MANNKLCLESENITFKSEDFSKKSFVEHSFSNCLFESCNFTESSWVNAKFCSCVFKNCNISLFNLKGCKIQEVLFEECKIVGAAFFTCNTKFIFSMDAKQSFIQYSNFSDLDMRKASFENSKIYSCTFINTCLTEANFSHTDLKETLFRNCNLIKSNFLKASNYIIDPLVNKIKKAKFSFPEVIGLLRSFDIKIV